MVGILAFAGLVLLFREKPKIATPRGPAALGLLVLVLAALIALVGVLAPSDAYDWDSLAYHLAVPKIWLAAGQIQFVSYIHHSNFPFLVDNLYIWGETWGGQAGAKAFSLAYCVYGTFAVFGLARARYGQVAAWWSTVAFATIPMVLWEAGTAYVDVAHALFGGLGIWLAAGLSEPCDSVDDQKEGSRWVLPALLLGGAVASKYTALQTLALVVFALLTLALLKKTTKPLDVVKMGVVALAIGSPWYIRNVIDTGNPVYPFFYSKLGGKNWDAFQETIYKDQQQTFGAGRPMADAYTAGPLEPARIGSSILGTAYMPGRYSDPAPTKGFGFPFVGLGAIPVATLLVWLASRRSRREEAVCLAVALASFAAWFFLSQQARYAFVWCVPLVIMAGGAVARLQVGRIVAAAIALQAAITLYVATSVDDGSGNVLGQKLRVALGSEDADAYQARKIGFYEPAKFLNNVAKGGRIALFDEVFGYLLDVPYFWAGPGHTTQLGYADMKSGDELVAALKAQGITHAYFALGTAFQGQPAERDRWLQAAGLNGPAVPYTGTDREGRLRDERTAYKVFLAEAVASGALKPIQEFRGGKIAFELTR